MTPNREMRTIGAITAWLLAAGCGAATSPVAPTAPSTPPAQGFTLTVLSGVERMPALVGAQVRAGSARLTTDSNGQVFVPLSALGLDDLYTVTAPDHVGYVSRITLGTVAILWPLVDGTTPNWVFSYSYTTNYGVEYLKRPEDEIRIQVPPELSRAAPPWRAAASVISEAGSPGAFGRVRIVDGEPGALLMVAAGTSCPLTACLPVQLARIEAIDYALEVLAGLTGFDLAGSRRQLGPPANTFTLTNAERTALRMRFLRVPGTIWTADNLESDWQIVDGTGNIRNR